MKMCNIVDMKIVKKLLFSGKAWGNFEKKIKKKFTSCEVKFSIREKNHYFFRKKIYFTKLLPSTRK